MLDTLLDANALTDAIKHIAGDSRLVWLVFVFSIYYIKSVIRNEKTITRIEDEAIREEEEKIMNRVKSKFATIESHMYEGVEQYVYSGEASRRLDILRTYSKISIPAKDYLRDYHGATKSVLFKVVAPYWVDEMIALGAPSTRPKEEDIDESATELRAKIITEIHKKAGVNKDIKEIENEIISFEAIREFAVNTIAHYEHLRRERDRKIEKETKAHRMPLVPRGKKHKNT